MSKEYNVKLQKKLEDYLEAEGLSQAKAAPILGISAAVLSQYRRSVYDKGDIGEVEKAGRILPDQGRTGPEQPEGGALPSQPPGIHPYIHIGSGLQVDPLLSA
ncbi:MAG: hypothetical protein ACLSAC_17550 [Enterocloster bolteae]